MSWVGMDGYVIKLARKRLGWSARQLAEASGVSMRTIQRIEAGEHATMPLLRRAVEEVLLREGLEFVSQNGKLGVIAPVKPRAVAHASSPPEIAPPPAIADPRAQLDAIFGKRK